MARLAIFGPGGLGRELIGMARGLASTGKTLVFVADDPCPEVFGIPVISPVELMPDDELVIALGSSAQRRSVAERLAHVKPGTLRAPTAVIGPGVDIGEGAVFCEFSMVTASARIGRHFQCNSYSYVSHDCVIGDYVTFAPRVGCNGNVLIEDGVYIGAGAVIKQGKPGQPTVIGAGAVVGMGAVVIKDVAPGTVVAGNPAKPLAPKA